MKIISQLDARGFFVCAVEADLSPLEKDVYLIPGGAVDVSPPKIPAGHTARLDAGKWVFDPIPLPPAEVPPPPHVETVAEKLAALDAANALTQRNLRETIMLMTTAVKQISGGAVDLAQLPGVAKVFQVEAQAAALRAQL